MSIRTRGWIIRCQLSAGDYWYDSGTSGDLELGDSPGSAYVFLTRFEAFAARNGVCSSTCCKVFRRATRKVPK